MPHGPFPGTWDVAAPAGTARLLPAVPQPPSLQRCRTNPPVSTHSPQRFHFTLHIPTAARSVPTTGKCCVCSKSHLAPQPRGVMT